MPACSARFHMHEATPKVIVFCDERAERIAERAETVVGSAWSLGGGSSLPVVVRPRHRPRHRSAREATRPAGHSARPRRTDCALGAHAAPLLSFWARTPEALGFCRARVTGKERRTGR